MRTGVTTAAIGDSGCRCGWDVEPGRGIVAIQRGPNRSVVRRAFASSPLRVLTPRNHGTAAWVFLASYGGGLLDGDALHVDVEVGSGARAMVSTQAWTKVFRTGGRGPGAGGQGASVELRATVGADGLLLLLPDPVVCFAGSRYEQIQRIEVEDGAGLVVLDWITAGRHAAGERWQFDRYASRLAIRHAGELVLWDSCLLNGEAGAVAARLGRFNVLCVLSMVGSPLQAEAQRVVEWAATRRLERRAAVLAGAAPLGRAGAVVRVAGESVEQVVRIVRDLLRFVPALLGDDPWGRKW